jgi:hypothetical protein
MVTKEFTPFGSSVFLKYSKKTVVSENYTALKKSTTPYVDAICSCCGEPGHVKKNLVPSNNSFHL